MLTAIKRRVFEYVTLRLSGPYLRGLFRDLLRSAGVWLVTVAGIEPGLVDSFVEPTAAILTGIAMFWLGRFLSVEESKKVN